MGSCGCQLISLLDLVKKAIIKMTKLKTIIKMTKLSLLFGEHVPKFEAALI